MKTFFSILGFIIMLPFIIIGVMIMGAIAWALFNALAAIGSFVIGVFLLYVILVALLDGQTTKVRYSGTD